MKAILQTVVRILAISLSMWVAVMIASAIFPSGIEGSMDQQAGKITALLLAITTCYAIILALVVSYSRRSGWILTAGLIFSFYGVQTVIGQIEAIAFLTPMGNHWGAGNVPLSQMPEQFIASQLITWAAAAIVGVVTTVLLFGKKKGANRERFRLSTPFHIPRWLVRLILIILVYELLYFGFGYYVAWKNPAVLNFYQGNDPGSFLAQMNYVASETPFLILLQAFRALLWTAFVLPVIRMLEHKGWKGALLTAIFVSVPMNIPHIMPNPYMPPDVRLIHFVETFPSTFIFGWILFVTFSNAESRKKKITKAEKTA